MWVYIYDFRSFTHSLQSSKKANNFIGLYIWRCLNPLILTTLLQNFPSQTQMPKSLPTIIFSLHYCNGSTRLLGVRESLKRDPYLILPNDISISLLENYGASKSQQLFDCILLHILHLFLHRRLALECRCVPPVLKSPFQVPFLNIFALKLYKGKKGRAIHHSHSHPYYLSLHETAWKESLHAWAIQTLYYIDKFLMADVGGRCPKPGDDIMHSWTILYKKNSWSENIIL